MVSYDARRSTYSPVLVRREVRGRILTGHDGEGHVAGCRSYLVRRGADVKPRRLHGDVEERQKAIFCRTHRTGGQKGGLSTVMTL